MVDAPWVRVAGALQVVWVVRVFDVLGDLLGPVVHHGKSTGEQEVFHKRKIERRRSTCLLDIVAWKIDVHRHTVRNFVYPAHIVHRFGDPSFFHLMLLRDIV